MIEPMEAVSIIDTLVSQVLTNLAIAYVAALFLAAIVAAASTLR